MPRVYHTDDRQLLLRHRRRIAATIRAYRKWCRREHVRWHPQRGDR